jgi:hypothetical protein
MSFENDQLSLDVTENDLAPGIGPDSTVTWSTDWTVSTVIDQLRRGRFDLEPGFQRRDVWSDRRRSMFVESLVLGIPVPQLILAERQDARGRFIVLDGKQRIRSLQRFAGLDGPAMQLTGLEVMRELNGTTYDDLIASPERDSTAAAFENAAIRAVVLRGWTNEALLYLTFLRLNSNVVGLSPQELRRALHPGPFMDFAMEHSGESPAIRMFLGTKAPDFRMRDVELLIRHVALTLRLDNYHGDLRRFLDESCEAFNRGWSDVGERVIEAARGLDAAIHTTVDVFGRDAFRRATPRGYERSRNRAVLDVMAFYLQHPEVRAELDPGYEYVRDAFESLCQFDSDFAASLTSTTKSVGAVLGRLARWGEALSGIAPSAARYVPQYR